MAQDKKAEGGTLTFILVHGLGDAFAPGASKPAAVSDFLIGEGAPAMTLARPRSSPPRRSSLALLASRRCSPPPRRALTGASRSRMHQLEREGDRAARRVNRLLSDQETMIGAVLLGYNVLNILSSALATDVHHAASCRGFWGAAIATGVMTVLVVVFVEVLPKTLAIVRADDVARWLSGPTLLVVRLFGPVIYTIQWIVRHTATASSAFALDMEVDVLAAHEEIRGAVEYHHSEGAG